MAVNPQYRRANISKIDKGSNSTKVSLSKASINILFPNGDEITDIFYLNPNQWTDKKSAQWVMHRIPGRSDPVLHWVGSGPRELLFTALVTRDFSLNLSSTLNPKSVSQFEVRQAKLVVRDPPLERAFDALPVFNDETSKWPIDITKKLDIYRSLVYPTIEDVKGTNRFQIISPPVVRVLIGSTLGIRGIEDVLWAVNNVEIRIIRQASNLAPIEAEVSFQLIEFTSTNIAGVEVSKNMNVGNSDSTKVSPTPTVSATP